MNKWQILFFLSLSFHGFLVENKRNGILTDGFVECKNEVLERCLSFQVIYLIEFTF